MCFSESDAVNPLAPQWLDPAVARELNTGVWPATAERDAAGELTIGGVRASELLERHGSPLYVIDEEDLRARAAAALTAFTEAFNAIGAQVQLHYASKALLSVDIARWMQQAGLGLDVASAGELEVALAAGINPETIGLHGNNKSDALLARAVEVGVGTVIIDSFVEIDRLASVAAELGKRQAVLLRINSGIHADTHSYLATSHEDQKFGITIASATEAVAKIRAHEALEFRGLHSHIGSSIYSAEGFGAAADRLMRLRAELLDGGPVPEVNLGGGFGIAYLPSDRPLPLTELARGIAAEVARACEDTGTELPLVTFEPGRSIAGPAGVTLYRVGVTKDVTVSDECGSPAVRRYVSVDGGMSDNARPAMYRADYCVRLATRESDASLQLVRVVGSHCESGDIVVYADYLPGDVSYGDILAVPATGAYCFAMASHYNYFDRPAMVAVRDGKSRTLVRRITIEDLLAADTASTSEEHS